MFRQWLEEQDQIASLVDAFIKSNPRNIDWACSRSTSNECNKISHLLLDFLGQHGIQAHLILGQGANFDTNKNKEAVSHWAVFVPEKNLVIDLTGAQFGKNQIFYNLDQWRQMWNSSEFASPGQYRILDKPSPWEDSFQFVNFPKRFPITRAADSHVT